MGLGIRTQAVFEAAVGLGLLLLLPSCAQPNEATASIHFQRGFAHHAREEPDKAHMEYTESLRLDPTYSTSYLNRGIIRYTRRADYPAAIADLTAVLALDPGNVTALMHRGAAFGANGDLGKGLADLDRAIEKAPDLGQAYRYRGALHDLGGNSERALSDYNDALRLDPQDVDAYIMRAAIYGRLRRYEAAMADLTDALKYRPQDYGAFYNRGFFNFAKGHYQQAIADYSEAIRIYPGFAAAYNNRCLSRAALDRDLGQAIGDCDRALALVPDSVEIRDTRGFLQLRLGDFAQAIVEYDAVLKDAPNDARALYGRGYAKTRIGDTSGGAADRALARKLDAGVAGEYARFGLK